MFFHKRLFKFVQGWVQAVVMPLARPSALATLAKPLTLAGAVPPCHP